MPGISAPTCPPAWRALRHRNRTDAPSSRFPPDRCSIEPVTTQLRPRLLMPERPARLNQPPEATQPAPLAAPSRRIRQERHDEAGRPGPASRRPALTSASRPGVIARSSPLSRSRSRSWSRTSDHIQLTRWSRRRRSSSPLSRSIRSRLPTRSHTSASPSPVMALQVTTGVAHPSLGRPSSRSARPARGRPAGPRRRAGRQPCLAAAAAGPQYHRNPVAAAHLDGR